jgi:hypothetical protein
MTCLFATDFLSKKMHFVCTYTCRVVVTLMKNCIKDFEDDMDEYVNVYVSNKNCYNIWLRYSTLFF